LIAALRLATGVLGQIRHHEERTPGMDPTGSFKDLARRAGRLVELAIAVSLEDPGVVGQVSLGMLAGPVARVIEHRPRRRRPAKRLVVAYIDPDPAGVGLALGQNRHRGVVAMQSLSLASTVLLRSASFAIRSTNSTVV
jgi:hypothetical protein